MYCTSLTINFCQDPVVYSQPLAPVLCASPCPHTVHHSATILAHSSKLFVIAPSCHTAHRSATILAPSLCTIFHFQFHLALVPNSQSLSPLLPQSHCAESTPERGRIDHQVYSGGHSWSFQSIPIHSNSVLLMRVGSVGEYKSFEHVQKLCVPSANKFHSCLCALKTCSYHVCRTAYVLYSSHSHYILTVFWLFLLYTRSFVHVGGTKNICDQLINDLLMAIWQMNILFVT